MSLAKLMITSVVLLTACDRILGLQPRDAPGDAKVTPDSTPRCYGSGGLLVVCVDDPLEPMLAVSGLIDTGADPRCLVVTQAEGPELCVMAAQQITVPQLARVRGTRPLVLVATGTISITSSLDVASKETGRIGPGASADCAAGDDGVGGVANASGGAGGSFGFRGGGGGSTTSLAGGTPGDEVPLVTVIGGCSGGSGGTT
ncbi:MAG: hypothetical protein H0X17_03600, partial [Deltaproteobacteria bacterium]|nr:hypothetical protein [Deltaproteobacteria bacterium]